METIAITNFNVGPFAANFFSTIAPGATKTKTLKSIDSDDHYEAYQRAAQLGAYISINGTLAAGAQLVTGVVTLGNATRAAYVDTTSGPFTVTLMPLAQVPVNGIVYVNFAVDGGDLTLDGNGAETINGLATLVLTSVGITRLKKVSATAWITL